MANKYVIIVMGALLIGQRADGLSYLRRWVAPAAAVNAKTPYFNYFAKRTLCDSGYESDNRSVHPLDFSALCCDRDIKASTIARILKRQPELAQALCQQNSDQSLFGDVGMYCDRMNREELAEALKKVRVLKAAGAQVLPGDIRSVEFLAVCAHHKKCSSGFEAGLVLSEEYRKILEERNEDLN